MTIKAVVGIIEMAAEPLPREAEEGPPGYPAASDFFSPNPHDDPGAIATFNVFLQSESYTGVVSLLKMPMEGEAEKRNIWFKPAGGFPLKPLYDWNIKSGDALCMQIQEPENNVRYCLGFGATASGGKCFYRMSI